MRRLAAALTIDRVSSVYLTEPVGITNQPDYLNLVLIGSTDRPVYDVQAAMHLVEEEMGRERQERNGPRPIDIDLVAYGSLVLTSSDLSLPHPRFAERAFVLAPIVEIEPDWRDPRSGATASELLARLENPTRIQKLGPL